MQNNIAETSDCTKVQNNIITISSRIKPNQANIECKLKESLKFKYWDLICKNSLVLLLYSLLYLDFDDAYYKDYNGEIE